jgi:Ca2+-binding RTX toxin-like protein
MSIQNVIFIDAAVANHETLIAGLPVDTAWFLIDGASDGVAQMQKVLADFSGLASVQIVSHGAAGGMQLGSTWLSSANVADHTDSLAAIGGALAAEGDLLLYGCSVAAGAAGQNFLDQLVAATGADIAASDDLTGAGGDWVLESVTGSIAAATLSPQGHMDTLATYTGGEGNDTITGTSSADIISGRGGNDRIEGRAGDDSVTAGAGNDTVSGGDGDDRLFGGEVRSNELSDTFGNNVLLGDGGNDYIVANIDVTANGYGTPLQDDRQELRGGTGNDTLIGVSANGQFHGDTGNDSFHGFAATVSGGEGNDSFVVTQTLGATNVVDGGAGWDVIKFESYQIGSTLGIAGFETWTLLGLNYEGTFAVGDGNIPDIGRLDVDGSGGASGDHFTVDASAVLIGRLTYLGSRGIDDFTGGAAADHILTGEGNDEIAGGGGDDYIDGGDGTDAASFSGQRTSYVVTEITYNTFEVKDTRGIDGTDTIVDVNLLRFADVTQDVVIRGMNIVGDENADELTGGNESDRLDGAGGNDHLAGNAGNDLIIGGTGNDTMTGGVGNDTYDVGSAGDLVSEASGAGVDKVVATIDYVLPGNVENLELGAGADVGTGNNLANVVTGNEGSNLLNGDSGKDTLAGGAGNDIYVVDNTGDVVSEASTAKSEIDSVQSSVSYTLGINLEQLTLTGSATGGNGNASANVITGNASANTLSGDAGNDSLNGGDGNDTVLGGTGNDTLSGGVGYDSLVGGSGNDVYVVDSSADVVTETTAGGTDRINSSVSRTLGSEIENLTLTGTGSTSGTGNALANIITGNAGHNVINGGAGADSMSGGTGNDTYHVDNLGDLVSEAATSGGVDKVIATIDYVMAGNVENLDIGSGASRGTGNALANRINGNAGNNTIDGGAGADTLAGGAGNDTYIVDSTADVVVETDTGSTGGTDLVTTSVTRSLNTMAGVENLRINTSAHVNGEGNGLANVLYAGAGNNTLDGLGGNDTVSYFYAAAGVQVSLATTAAQATSGSGSDTLRNVEHLSGSKFADKLAGHLGNNTLDGRDGADTLTGGAGSDTFMLRSLVGSDTITDFASGTDRIMVRQSTIHVGDGDTLVEGAVTVVGPGGFSASAELIVVTGNIAGSITAASAAAKIGSASSAYAVGRDALFMVDNGSSSALYLFSAIDADAQVEAGELTLLATLTGTAATTTADLLFGS